MDLVIETKETVLSPDEKEKIERLQNERCPLCLEVTLAMVCWPKCLHKICLECGYRLVRSTKPHGSIVYDGQTFTIHLSYSHQNILCPICRGDQSSSFSGLESKLLSNFVLPSMDWKTAMTQRVKDIQHLNLPDFQVLCSFKCVKCPLVLNSLEQCISHVSRCSENSIFCPFCHSVLTPTLEEKGVMTRVEEHLRNKCQCKISCNFPECNTKIPICRMVQHRRIHSELILLGEFLSDGKRKFVSLSDVKIHFRGEKWEEMRKRIDISLKTENSILQQQRVNSPDDRSFDTKELRQGSVPVRADHEAEDGNEEEDDEEEEEEEADEFQFSEDHDVNMIYV
jgi:hypothetical protein